MPPARVRTTQKGRRGKQGCGDLSRSRLSRLVKSSRKLFGRKHDNSAKSNFEGRLQPAELDELTDQVSSLDFAREGGSGEEQQEEGAYQWSPPDPKWIDLKDVRLWIDTCDAEHGEECHPSSPNMDRPIWLIDVVQGCIVPAGQHQYIALSYVWGGVESAQTTLDNLEQMQLPGTLEEGDAGEGEVGRRLIIPKTVRHAMGLVKRLGEQHLWVDRFCICQDDAKTKHAQIQSMAGIYSNAYLTIVAADEWDANHGLRDIEGVTKPRNLSPYLSTSQYVDLTDIHNSIWNIRNLTYPEDGLQAYLGIISQMSDVFPEGFFWALPISCFHAALLWQPRETLKRRRPLAATTDTQTFPSWSWVGWQGGIDCFECHLPPFRRRALKPLCVWKTMDQSQVIRPLYTGDKLAADEVHTSLHHENPFLYTHAPVARAWLGRQSDRERSPSRMVENKLKKSYGLLMSPRNCELFWIYSSWYQQDSHICGAMALSPGLRGRSDLRIGCEVLAISTCHEWNAPSAEASSFNF
ncbi:HET-domain-containing protein [Apiospora hydei]|uniref:HET-domain-containing protein n=1 Tax=Apiospora hydei TaxID=1337664 RepID=A0ABR1VVJ6_9PEZI